MASFVTKFLNVYFRHLSIIEDTQEERRRNAARPLPQPPKGVTVRDAGLGVPCEIIEKSQATGIFMFSISTGADLRRARRRRRARSPSIFARNWAITSLRATIALRPNTNSLHPMTTALMCIAPSSANFPASSCWAGVRAVRLRLVPFSGR